LGEVDRGDVAGLEEVDCLGEFGTESGEELAPSGQRGVSGAGSTDEDDAGGESVRQHADEP